MLRWLTFAAAVALTPPASSAGDISLQQLLITGVSPQSWSDVQQLVMEPAGVVPVNLVGTTSLGALIEEKCPGAGDEYLASLPESLEKLNPGLFTEGDYTLSAVIGRKDEASTLFLPYCLGFSAPRYVVQPTDNLWNMYHSPLGMISGVDTFEAYFAECKRLNGAGACEKLIPGNAIVLPSNDFILTVPEETADSLVQELQQIESIGDILLQKPSLIPIDFADGTLAQDPTCPEETGATSLQAAEKRLWDLTQAMIVNGAVDDANSSWQVRPGSPVQIAVFDTGVNGIDKPLVRGLLGQLGSFSQSDQIALPDHPEGFHGTGVFFTAGGGHLFSPLTRFLDIVQIVPHRVFEPGRCDTNACSFEVKNDRLLTGMTVANNNQSTISGINISLSFVEGPPYFDDQQFFKQTFVNPNTRYLIVTSAGNKSQTLGDSYKIYPALLGGDEESNLVTVAAVTSDGALLAQSNRSSKYVDIAAWGCNVPVIEFDNGVGDFIRRYRSGTSYAAPQVLFTAAMIAREERKGSSRFSPAELKMRLLASADLSVALWEHVKHGRILNTSKAISLHTDVVELQSGEILRGRVKFNDDQGAEVALCGDASVPRSKILKVTNLGQVPEPGARSTIIYARDAAGKFSVLWCNGITASISFEDALTRGTPRDIPFAEIKDIVMASKPYWR